MRGKSKKVQKKPIAYVIKDKHFGDLEVLNTANAWWLDKAKVHDLIVAFKIDATVEEALVFAGITVDQWQYFNKLHPKFSAIKDAIKNLPTLKARKTVNSKLDESYSNAMDYLKRKRRDEFGDSINQNIQGKIDLIAYLEQIENGTNKGDNKKEPELLHEQTPKLKDVEKAKRDNGSDKRQSESGS